MAPAIALSALASLFQVLGVASASIVTRSTFPVSSKPPSGISAALPEAFVSYSIELAFFPDYAGNFSSPNIFSNNLLDNIGHITGTKPYIRVGGNTQDYAIYNASQKEGLIGIYRHAADDYPSTVTIGPAFFESYQTWPDTKFTHGFNLKAANTTAGANSLTQSAAVACKALGYGNLLWWEYGNEPDLYINSDSVYITEWLSGTRLIKASIGKSCPSMEKSPNYGWIAPSLSSTGGAVGGSAFEAGLDVDKDIELISMHLYMGSATGSGVTLQGTLLNHQHTTSAVAKQVKELDNLTYTGIPYILGEANSLFKEGAPGLSNTFGAALWGVDFNLWCASVGIRRVHMHQGTSYRYASWQPIQATKAVIGTKPPYYGNIAVAAMLGNLLKGDVQILNIELTTTAEAAYAAYVDGKLARILVINMNEYNYTVGGQLGAAPNPVKRPSNTYSFSLNQTSGTAHIQRLLANGSDALSGITWDGYSYNYELDKGKPVKMKNVTVGETAKILGGVVRVSVPDSSIAMLNF